MSSTPSEVPESSRINPSVEKSSVIEPIGDVCAVTGSKITCRVIRSRAPEGASTGVQIGALVKMSTKKSINLGLVSSLQRSSGTDTAEINLFGEIRFDRHGTQVFARGISSYPELGMPVYPASPQELAGIYSARTADTVAIGTLHQDPTVRVHLSTEAFLSRHSAIVGTTGTGKSCALALILRSLLTAYPNGHVIVIDPHGEYATAFDDMAERISATDLKLPYWLLNFEEITELLCSKDLQSRAREAAILRDAIIRAKEAVVRKSDPHLLFTVDTPVPYQLLNVQQYISEAMGKLNRPDNTPLAYLRLLDTIESIGRDERYRFMFGQLASADDFVGIVSRLIRIPVRRRPITIVDIASLPAEVTDVVVSVLCRIVFDFARWSHPEEIVPVLFVFDEAHRYIPRDPGAGFEPTRRSISRIAKEGRKYGISLCLVTQRPAEIAESVLSQCSTLFALRLANEHDQEFVRRALPEDASGLFESLPTLAEQEAIAVGEGVAHPMRLKFDPLPLLLRPRSTVSDFTTAWGTDSKSQRFVETVINRWRHLSYSRDANV